MRRGFSTFFSCGLGNQQYMRASCEFGGERWLPPAIAGSCRDFARPALDYRIRNDLLFGLLMRIECERPKFRQSKVSAKMAKKLSGTMAFGALQKLDNWLIMWRHLRGVPMARCHIQREKHVKLGFGSCSQDCDMLLIVKSRLTYWELEFYALTLQCLS